jgi:hypothetical protein
MSTNALAKDQSGVVGLTVIPMIFLSSLLSRPARGYLYKETLVKVFKETRKKGERYGIIRQNVWKGRE